MLLVCNFLDVATQFPSKAEGSSPSFRSQSKAFLIVLEYFFEKSMVLILALKSWKTANPRKMPLLLRTQDFPNLYLWITACLISLTKVSNQNRQLVRQINQLSFVFSALCIKTPLVRKLQKELLYIYYIGFQGVFFCNKEFDFFHQDLNQKFFNRRRVVGWISFRLIPALISCYSENSERYWKHWFLVTFNYSNLCFSVTTGLIISKKSWKIVLHLYRTTRGKNTQSWPGYRNPKNLKNVRSFDLSWYATHLFP